MKKWTIFVISALSALVLLLSGALIAVTREEETGEEIQHYPVTKFHDHQGIADWRDWSLEEAVVESALVAVCTVSELLPSYPVIHYDPDTGEELSRGARTPVTLQIETVLKGDSTRETVTYLMPKGTFIEKIGEEWFVYHYMNNFPSVEAGDHVLIFLTEKDEPLGPLIIWINDRDMLQKKLVSPTGKLG